MSQALGNNGYTAVSHLMQVMPPVLEDPLFPGAVLRHPGIMEIDQFVRTATALEDPASIFDRYLEGMLTQQEVQAVEAVYPVIMSEIRMSVAEVFAEAGPQRLSYAIRRQTSILLGADTDPLSTGMAVHRFQNMGAQTEAQAATIGTPSTRSPNLIESFGSQYQRLVN
jgi:hypothetical protein